MVQFNKSNKNYLILCIYTNFIVLMQVQYFSYYLAVYLNFIPQECI